VNPTDLAALVSAHEVGSSKVLRYARDLAREHGLDPPTSLAEVELELVEAIAAWIRQHPDRPAVEPADMSWNTLPADPMQAFDFWFEYEVDDERRGMTRREVLRELAKDDRDEFLTAWRAEHGHNPYGEIFTGLLGDVRERARPPAWRVEGLIPADGRCLIVAQRKTGKTTLALNIARALTTGEDFLGRLPAVPVGRVGYLNFEVAAWQIARWATEHGIPDDQLWIANLRGQPNPFATSAGTRWLTDQLQTNRIEVVIVDPFERAYTGTSSNDAREVIGWLAALDQIATDAGISEVILVHHAGWVDGRSRGSTAIEDWPDTIITLTAVDNGARYLRAIGRDVDLTEDELAYDTQTRRLHLTGNGPRTNTPNRPGRADRDLDAAVYADVTAVPDLSVSERERRIREQRIPVQRGEVGRSLARLVAAGRITEHLGTRGAKHHKPASAHDLSRPIPTCTTGTGDLDLSRPVPTPPLGGRAGIGHRDRSEHHDGHPHSEQVDDDPEVF
jgi:AAA domain